MNGQYTIIIEPTGNVTFCSLVAPLLPIAEALNPEAMAEDHTLRPMHGSMKGLRRSTGRLRRYSNDE